VSGREPGLLEFRGQKKDGSVIPIEISLTPILQDKTITGVQSITRDITERKRVERALERSEKFLKEAQRIAHLGAWIWDIRDNSEWWSDEQFRIFGFEPGQIKPIVGTFTEAVHPEDKEAVLEAVQKTIEKNAPFDAEFRIVRPDGTIRFVYAQGEVERSKDGKPWRMIGTVLDITRRRKTEQALKESEEKFQSISSSMKDALLTMDDRGEITYWNEAAGKIFGYTKDEVMGKDLHRLLVPEKYRDTFGKGFPKFTATGTGPAIGQILELSALHKDGTEFPIELSLSSIHISEAWQAVGTIRDISDRKGAEQEREKLISDLQNTLKEVKKLSGLLPICSHCKKIRDDNGYWSQIEAYFHKHSEAEFSHSICPECAKKYYPDIDLSEDSE
ncbi:MAG: PAS domain S-box protein, partial [Deltaproteobacteria bacterium]|nr:PAS domain S-box protein [Deltaproteobacteria bacterium]